MINNPEIEQAIIAAIFNKDTKLGNLYTEIEPEWFYNSLNREIFQITSKAFWDVGKVDLLLFSDSTEKMDYIMGCIDRNPFSRHEIPGLISKLKELYLKRRLKKLGITLEQKVSKASVVELTNDILDEIEIISGRSGEQTDSHLSETINRFSSKEAFKSLSESCLKTNIGQFNRNVIIKPDDYTIIAGRTSQGKSAFSLALAHSIASHDQPILFITLEMRNEYLLKRLACMEGNGNTYEHYKAGCEKLAKLPMYFKFAKGLDVFRLKNEIAVHIQKYGIKAVFIDYFQLMSMPKEENRNLSVGEASRQIKAMCRFFGIPIFSLCQINRAVTNRPDKRPTISDLRDSGRLEEDADNILLCYLPSAHDIEESHESIPPDRYWELIVGKARDAQIGRMIFDYHKHVNKFKEINTVHEYVPQKSEALF